MKPMHLLDYKFVVTLWRGKEFVDRIYMISHDGQRGASRVAKTLKFQYKEHTRSGSAVPLLMWPSRTAWTATASAACPVADKIHARRIDL